MATEPNDDPGPLDGNAAAGLLSECFAIDLTAAKLTCAHCGTSAEIGAIHAYGGQMGAILRCIRCDGVVMRFAKSTRGFVLDLHGARSIAGTVGR